jgi:hypothetical protein
MGLVGVTQVLEVLRDANEGIKGQAVLFRMGPPGGP